MDGVVLLHGLGRTHLAMRPLARALDAEGYWVQNVDYPSTCERVEALAASHAAPAAAALRAAGCDRVHFVTHSMGGILVRALAARQPLPEGTRVVMIAPPNAGSEAADRVRAWPGFRRVCGPALRELGTGPESVPRALGPVTFEAGVVAGDADWYPWSRWFFGDEPSDGTVPIHRTRVDGLRDAVVVPRGHAFIMRAPETVRQTLHFLRHGRFDHADARVRPLAGRAGATPPESRVAA